MGNEMQDDGDVRPAALFRLPRPARVPRPWLRGFVLGLLLGALVASLVWLLALRGVEKSLRPSWSIKTEVK